VIASASSSVQPGGGIPCGHIRFSEQGQKIRLQALETRAPAFVDRITQQGDAVVGPSLLRKRPASQRGRPRLQHHRPPAFVLRQRNGCLGLVEDAFGLAALRLQHGIEEQCEYEAIAMLEPLRQRDRVFTRSHCLFRLAQDP